MTMIKKKAIQYLIDEHAGYGQRTSDRYVLDSLIESDTGKHLFVRKSLTLYIHNYINATYQRRHGRFPETDAERHTVIRTDGDKSATVYCLDDIRRMINDPMTANIINDALSRRTTLYNGVRVPKVVAAFYHNQNGTPGMEKVPALHAELRTETTANLLMTAQFITAELMRRETEHNLLRNPPSVA